MGFHLVMVHFEGSPRKTGIELSLMTRYFSFLVVVRPCGSSGVTKLTATTAWFPCRDHLRRCHPSDPRADEEPNLNPQLASHQPPQSFDFLPYLRDPPSPLWHGWKLTSGCAVGDLLCEAVRSW